MRTCAKWAAVFGVISVLSAPAASAAPDLPPITPVLSSYQGCRTASTVDTNDIPWAQAMLRPDRAWQHANGAGVTVAVVDTGVDATSPALAGRVANAGEDCVGHGTFVAGLIAATPRQGGGFTGIAPGARIVAVRATDQAGNATADGVANGIRSAVAGGARVIQVSAAVTEGNGTLAAAVRDATAAGAVVIAPSSTGDPDKAVPSFPGAYPEVIAVSAIAPNGAPVRASAPEIKVDLAAPGAMMTGIGPRGNGLFVSGGDAVAAAQVSGAAALVLSYRPALSPQEVVRRLRDTAYPPPGSAPDPLLGSGVIDPEAALTAEFPTAGGKPPVVPAAVHMPPPVDTTPEVTAAVVATAAAVVIAAVTIAAAIIPRGRKRGWRAAP
ncbi:S8 family serine peptidase [Saccharopolyspora sp. NPDC050642]|uniref:S8 family serine peptidase n=1 Tax=Saccharopolyspora sp. NPDC050642 TaxID=3157099 RepID=UPI0033F6E07D